MIVESKAIEPKAGSATSVYPAVIVNINNTQKEDMFVYLQIYCPAVMSGNHVDAKYVTNNFVEAPKKPHNGADDYDFQVGGIIMISYQNGNINSPQFVRYVNISERVLERNKRLIETESNIPYSDAIINVDADLDLSEPILSVGVALLPVLINSSSSNYLFHTFAEDKWGTGEKGNHYLSIFRCGIFETELVMLRSFDTILNLTQMSKFAYDYLETAGEGSDYNATYKMFQYFVEKDEQNYIIDVVNDAIKSYEDNENLVTEFSKNNAKDIAYWWTQIAGYTFETTARKITQMDYSKYELTKPIRNSKLSKIMGNYTGNDNFGYTFNYVEWSLYYGYMRGLEGSNSIPFINILWQKFCNNSFFNNLLKSRYAIILTNNYQNIKNTYNCKNSKNKTLLKLTVIATSFPVLCNVILSFNSAIRAITKESVITEELSEKFVKPIIDSMQNDKPLAINTTDMSKYLTTLYFRQLGFPEEGDIYENVSNPATSIRISILGKLNYIDNTYNKIVSGFKQ